MAIVYNTFYRIVRIQPGSLSNRLDDWLKTHDKDSYSVDVWWFDDDRITWQINAYDEALYAELVLTWL